MMNKRYVADRAENGTRVSVYDDQNFLGFLPDKTEVARFTKKCGLSWGYHGTAPAQLAFAMLADYTDDVKRALTLFYPFVTAVIQNLPQEKWEITGEQIDEFLAASVE